MEIQLIGSTNGMKTMGEFKKFAQIAARICYSEKDVDDLHVEDYNEGLVDGRLIRSGHHSPFEHTNMTFYMKGIPKILAMVLNNERQYATSEKSARYTVMKDIPPEQKDIYEGWLEVFEDLISVKCPQAQFPKLYVPGGDKKTTIQKLAQENARYVTSVFTPTRMVYTVNLRQLNFIIDELNEYSKKNCLSEGHFEKCLAGLIPNFTDQLKQFKIAGLENKTDRHLSLFNFSEADEHFSDVYSTQYFMSFAGLAQAHRHRTVGYNMQAPQINAPLGFFVPAILEGEGDLTDEWLKDLENISKTDYPQAQMLLVRERGTLEDFRSKCMLRLCGHAQNEIMRNTKETAENYAKHVPQVSKWISAKCMQGFECKEPCVWTGKRALERIV